MAVPAPRHVNQFSAAGKFPNGTPSSKYDCTVAVGVMVLDAATGGAVRVSTTELRGKQHDQDGPGSTSPGIGLDDLAVALKTYGFKFVHGPKAWGTIMARLRRGDPVAVQGLYIALGSWRAPGSKYAKGHAVYLQRVVPKGIVVNDSLRNGEAVIPESAVRNFYLSGLALAGWIDGAVATSPAPAPTPAPAPAPVGTVVRILPVSAVTIGTSGGCAGVEPVKPSPPHPGVTTLPDVFPIPANRVSDPCACPDGYNRAQVEPGLRNFLNLGGYVPLDQLTAGQANACAQAKLGPGSVFGQELAGGAGDIAGQVAAGLNAGLGALLDPLGGLFRSTGLFLAILALLVLGLYIVVKGR
jgi:hypothetical protein